MSDLLLNGSELAVSTDVGINANWDFNFSIEARVWADSCVVPPPRGHTTAQALRRGARDDATQATLVESSNR